MDILICNKSHIDALRKTPNETLVGHVSYTSGSYNLILIHSIKQVGTNRYIASKSFAIDNEESGINELMKMMNLDIIGSKNQNIINMYCDILHNDPQIIKTINNIESYFLKSLGIMLLTPTNIIIRILMDTYFAVQIIK